MKHPIKKASILFVLFAFLLSAYIHTQILSQESYTTFAAKSAVGKVHGKIPGIHGEIKFNEKDLANSYFNTWIGPQDLDTKNGKRDKHLKSEDFLEVTKYPKIHFKSKKIEKTDQGYSATGDLTIKETTKEVTIPFTYEEQGNKGTFKGTLSIKRKDYGVGGNTKLAGDEIDIDIVTVVQK